MHFWWQEEWQKVEAHVLLIYLGVCRCTAVCLLPLITILLPLPNTYAHTTTTTTTTLPRAYRGICSCAIGFRACFLSSSKAGQHSPSSGLSLSGIGSLPSR